MNLTTEELPGCKVRLQFELDASDVQALYDQVYNELNSLGRVRGFRPGKAPRALLVRNFGEKTIRDQALARFLEEHVEKAIADLKAIGKPDLPDLDDIPFAEGQPFEFTCTVTVPARVKIGDLTGIELVRPVRDTLEQDVERVLEELQDTHAQEVATDRSAVAIGDAVDLELQVTVEGEQEPQEPLEQTIVVGKGTHFPPVDDLLPGRLVGQEVEMDVTYPQDYHDETLAGKSAHIRARIVALRERKLPPLDDEFAQMVDPERYSSLEDLRQDVRRQMERADERFAAKELELQVIKHLMERSEVDVPEVMVDVVEMQEAGEALKYTLPEEPDAETLLSYVAATSPDIRSVQRARARQLLKWDAIMSEWLGDEPEPVSDAEIEREAERYALEKAMEVDFVRQAAQLQPDFRDTLQSRALRRRIIEGVISQATLREMPLQEYHEVRDELLRFAIDEGQDKEAEGPEASQEEAAGQEPGGPQPAFAVADAAEAADTRADEHTPSEGN